jgi:hypothetical protein
VSQKPVYRARIALGGSISLYPTKVELRGITMARWGLQPRSPGLINQNKLRMRRYQFVPIKASQ